MKVDGTVGMYACIYTTPNLMHIHIHTVTVCYGYVGLNLVRMLVFMIDRKRLW